MKQFYELWLSVLDSLGEIQPSFERFLDVSDSECACDDETDSQVDSTELSDGLTASSAEGDKENKEVHPS